MLESKLKANQREEFMELGWVFVQVGNDAPTGFPDTLCLSPTGYSCYVEWKKSKNAKRQPLQDYWNERLNDMGHDAFFVYPTIVDEWKAKVIRRSDDYEHT